VVQQQVRRQELAGARTPHLQQAATRRLLAAAVAAVMQGVEARPLLLLRALSVRRACVLWCPARR